MPEKIEVLRFEQWFLNQGLYHFVARSLRGESKELISAVGQATAMTDKRLTDSEGDKHPMASCCAVECRHYLFILMIFVHILKQWVKV